MKVSIFRMITFEVMLDMDIFMKFAPASVATAFASIVLPVPGGPKSSIPLQGYKESTHQYPNLANV